MVPSLFDPNASGPPTSPGDQIERLLRRGILIQDFEEALLFLSNVNFYRLRSYLEPFVDQTSTCGLRPFQADTTLEAVLERYRFDTWLRVLMLGAFNYIEVSIRTQWTFHLSYSQGGGEYAHLSPQFFGENYSNNLTHLKDDYDERGKDLHGYDFQGCPIWAVSEMMSFGQLSRWHGDTILSVRKAVASHYQLHWKVLGSLLRHLTTIRNLCAHHERLWDRDFATRMSRPKTQMGAFSNPRAFFNEAATGRLYNTLVMVAYLTRVITGNPGWTIDLIALMSRFPNIPQERMGFISNWKESEIWQV